MQALPPVAPYLFLSHFGRSQRDSRNPRPIHCQGSDLLQTARRCSPTLTISSPRSLAGHLIASWQKCPQFLRVLAHPGFLGLGGSRNPKSSLPGHVFFGKTAYFCCGTAASVL